MTIIRINFFGCFLICLSSCVSFDAALERSVSDIKVGSCKKTQVMLRFSETHESFTVSNRTSDPYEVNRGGIKNPTFFVAERLKVRSVFAHYNVDSAEEQSKIIEFHTTVATRTSAFEKILGGISFFTLGIIPSYSDGYISVDANVIDQSGKSYKKYSSSKVDFKFASGIIVLPLAFFHTFTLASIEEQYFPKLTDEIIDQMINDKLACENSMETGLNSN